MKKRITCLLLAVSLLACLLAGCMPKLPTSAAAASSASAAAASSSGSAAASADDALNNKDTVKLTVFSQTANWSGAQAGWGATLLKDMFNIELTIIPDTDGAYETRMEAGDLGDIVVWGNNGDQYKAAVDKGMLFNWEDEDLVTTYGTNIEKYFPDALEANRTLNDDGSIYGIGHSIASESGEHDLFFYDWGTRWDLYKQLGYPEVKDLDDLADVLGQMKEICPTGDDGKPAYAVSIWPDWDGDMVMYVKALASGYTGYDELGIGLYDPKTGTFYDCLDENGPYVQSLRFFNKLYQNDLLDPDSMTQTYDTMIAKVRNGNVLFSIFDYAGSIAFNSDQHIAADEYMASLVPEDAHDIVYALNTTGNERIWSIGSNCVYPEKAMQLIDWLCTPEGAMTNWYGIRGLMWDYDENGNTYFTELGQKCANDASCDLTGVEWTSPYTGKTYTLDGTFSDGGLQMNNITWALGATNPDSNGEKFSKVTWASQIGDAKNDAEADWRAKTGADSTQKYLDSTDYSMVPKVNMAASEKSAELDLEWQQVTKAIREGSWNAMYAKTDAEFEQIVSQMRTSCDGYGYDDCVEWCRNEAAKRFSLQ